ncbi:MAG: GntR family transcriptional regulator [Ruminococcus sp.]|nr:GntR family transcriptional regulator [Ruminococcus sp.]
MWEFSNDRPVYLQIIDVVLTRIASGVYNPGERIPSVRDLAEEARVNPNTMQKALSEIERLGYITSQRTAGKFITEDTAIIGTLKKSKADNILGNFVDEMKMINISIDEAIELLKKYDSK